jgi:Domain of Unknown Function with PDB structure (DUF3857)/Transglutaminase-like superfamily
MLSKSYLKRNKMTKILIAVPLFVASLCSSLLAFAQYDSKLIAPSLLANANVIVRLEEKNILIKNEGNTIVKHKYVYTILNAGGDGYALFQKGYDKLTKIQNISGDLFDATGNKLKSLKKNEIKDYSNTSESNLADDDRVKMHNFNHRIYPYTVVYESEEEMNGTFYLPAWVPVFNEKIAVEKTSLTVEAPAEYNLRYKSFNYITEPVITPLKNTKEYKWTLAAYNAITKESYSPSWYEITPAVFLAPSNFEMQQYKGKMNNWKEFGLFFYKLNEGRAILPDNIRNVVHQLTDKLPDNKEKINALYKYLQKNTRYISIQLGIGGWQTLDANFVATNGYGDCKALTNYMYALLKEAGIKSYYTLVKSGDGVHSFIKDFSSNQFNHIILCVPQNKDSTWLECTSQTLQPGYLSSFTSDRPVLMIDENGGVLTTTPRYNADDNLQVRNINAVLNADGMLNAEVLTSYRGEQQDDLHGMLSSASKEQIREYLDTKFDLPSYQVNNYTHQELFSRLPLITEQVSLTAKDYASVSGKRVFINPNILSVSTFKIKNAAARKYDFEMNYAFTDYDTVHITIPEGYKPESIPSDVSINLPFAQYKSSVKIETGKIIYTRYYKQASAKLPASEAPALAEFFEKIYKADHARIVFLKENKE